MHATRRLTDNTAVVTVESGGFQRGLIHGVSRGVASVIASHGGLTAKSVIQVK